MFIKPSYIYLSLFCRRCAWRVRVCMDMCVYPPLNFENGHAGRSTPRPKAQRDRTPGTSAAERQAPCPRRHRQPRSRAGRRTGRANPNRDRARVSPPVPPLPRSCQPVPARASPSKRHGRAPDRVLGIEPSGRMVQSSPLPARPPARRRPTLGRKDACGRPNPRRRKSLPRPPARSRLGPPMLPPPPARARKRSPVRKNIFFAKIESPLALGC